MTDLAGSIRETATLPESILDACIPVKSTGVTRDLYLDIAEVIVRTAIPWQREDGVIIDPTTGDEPVTTTARFVGALGLLIDAGRCADLVEHCALSMDVCCSGMRSGEFNGKFPFGAEFFTKELVYAFRALAGRAARARHQEWARCLSHMDPKTVYGTVAAGQTHNIPVYALTGEFLKERYGLGESRELVGELLETQRAGFTSLGMYRDPNDPITYDLTVRQQLDLMLHHGYDGPHADWMRDVTRKGGLATLLFQSSTGQAPFGGRSNQFHFQEGMMACIFEMQAREWHEAGEAALAGALKRAARRAAMCVRPWIMEMQPFRQTKNGFAPELRHAVDSGGEYASYGLLGASVFATAWHLADESIGERQTPAEAGGYVLELWPEFHKVLATCGGYHIEIDTRADPEKDATGLGRFHLSGAPPELALSMPICARDGYTRCTPVPPDPLAIGPGWRDGSGELHRLAEFSAQIEDVRVALHRQDSEGLRFDVVYTGDLDGVTRVTEEYELTPEGLRYAARLEPAPEHVSLRIPLLMTDGLVHSSMETTDTGFTVMYGDHRYAVSANGASPTIAAAPPVSNRNGLYAEGILHDCLEAHFSMQASVE